VGERPIVRTRMLVSYSLVRNDIAR
jgi:hypothetical protein